MPLRTRLNSLLGPPGFHGHLVKDEQCFRTQDRHNYHLFLRWLFGCLRRILDQNPAGGPVACWAKKWPDGFHPRIISHALQGVGRAGRVSLGLIIAYGMASKAKYPIFAAALSVLSAIVSLTELFIGGGFNRA